MLPVTGEIRRGLLGCDQPLGPGLQGDFRCRFPGPYTRPVPLCASAAGVLLPVTAVLLLVQYTQSPAVCQPGIGERDGIAQLFHVSVLVTGEGETDLPLRSAGAGEYRLAVGSVPGGPLVVGVNVPSSQRDSDIIIT